MNTNIIIIGIGSILLFVVPFILFAVHQRTKDKRAMAGFMNEALKLNAKLSTTEQWNSAYCIGVDANGRKLYYRRTNDYKPETVLVDLNDISKCRVANTSHFVKTKSEKISIIDTISLVLENKNTSKPAISLEVYNVRNASNANISSEQEIATKWETIVNDLLAK